MAGHTVKKKSPRVTGGTAGGVSGSRPVSARAEQARQARLRTNLTPGQTAGPRILPPAQMSTVGPTGPSLNPPGVKPMNRSSGHRRRTKSKKNKR